MLVLYGSAMKLPYLIISTMTVGLTQWTKLKSWILLLVHDLLQPMSSNHQQLVADKLLDLANYAAVGCIFSQFILETINWNIAVVGVLIWAFLFFFIKLYLKAE